MRKKKDSIRVNPLKALFLLEDPCTTEAANGGVL